MEMQSEANFPVSLCVIVLRKRNRSLKVLGPLSELFSALFIVFQEEKETAEASHPAVWHQRDLSDLERMSIPLSRGRNKDPKCCHSRNLQI